MRVQQIRTGLRPTYEGALLAPLLELEPHVLLAFGSAAHFEQAELFHRLHHALPDTLLIGCSTAGEICRDGAFEGQAILTGIRFTAPLLRTASSHIPDMEHSREAGRRLGRQLAHPMGADPLRSVLILGQGVRINGSDLLRGLTEALGPAVHISGALAGDGGAFTRTYTLLGGLISDQHAVALGFYGDHVALSTGSAGGWEPFGPVRRITRSAANILFELDGVPALEVYKRYLGAWAKDLPGSGLLFPFALLGEDERATGLIRTMLGLNEAEGSLTMAGDMPSGGYVRLMHAGTSALVEGARDAARAALLPDSQASLGLLFSCVGRKLLMGGRVDEEVEVVSEVVGRDRCLTGFYSYGEFGAPDAFGECRLHNQTMTVTLLQESA